ncbi:hypothetical protein EC988_005560, partial [Linderina pennispora]
MNKNPSTIVVLNLSGVSFDISVQPEHHSAATELASVFANGQPEPLSTSIVVLAKFILYCSSRNPDVTISVFKSFHAMYCSMDDIHSIVQQHKLSVEQSRIVLKGYYSAWSLLEARQQLPNVRLPALFSSPSLKTIAQFGGQSGAPNFMDEAAWLFDVYHPLLSDFVEYMSHFLHRESMDLVLDGTLEQPLDFVGWLLKPETAPDTQHLHAAPIAFPFIGLFQLMHLVVLYKTFRIDPGELTTLFR